MNTKDLERQHTIKLAKMHLKRKDLMVFIKTIPEGECTGCGRCCGESVRTHFVEFLN